MDVSGFFAYPGQDTQSTREEIVFLPSWDEPQWARLLEHTETRVFRAGEDVIRMGDVDRALSIVTNGTLEVVIPAGGNRTKTVTRIEAGGVIGEVAFIDGQPRSATVRAATSGELVHLSLAAFGVFAAREPDLARELLFDIARILALRLRTTTSALARAGK